MIPSPRHRLLVGALALFASGLLVAFERPVGQVATWEQSFPIGGLTVVSLDTLNGSISVETWDRSEVAVQAILRAYPPTSAEALRQLDATQIGFRLDGSALRGEVQAPRPGADSVSVDFTLQVPPFLALELATASGAISATGVAAPLSLRSGNGSLAVFNAGGPVTLETANGSIAVYLPPGAGAQLDLVTANGQISVPAAGVGNTTRLTTILGAGGPRIQARTASGAILVAHAP
jgi:hypothetical protein